MGFTDAIDHEWMLKFLEHRIADRRVLRLIRKWLKAGVIEHGEWTETEEGTPQGASASPLLSNVYLHYVFDLWAHQWRRRNARGDVVLVRFADDYVAGFQYRDDAERFLAELRDRLAKFSLELHAEKTRLIQFGRFAAQQRTAAGPRQAGDLRLLGLYAYLREDQERDASRYGASRSRSGNGRSYARSRKSWCIAGICRSPSKGNGWRAWCEGTALTMRCPGNYDAVDAFCKEVTKLWFRGAAAPEPAHSASPGSA